LPLHVHDSYFAKRLLRLRRNHTILRKRSYMKMFLAFSFRKRILIYRDRLELKLWSCKLVSFTTKQCEWDLAILHVIVWINKKWYITSIYLLTKQITFGQTLCQPLHANTIYRSAKYRRHSETYIVWLGRLQSL
jgi:hypothetical protein